MGDALTEDNILLSWNKTGLCPVDPSVITPAMLAPSKVFAQDETFPIPPSSPIHGVIAAFKEMHINSQDFSNITPPSQPSGSNAVNNVPSHHSPVPDALASLTVDPIENPPPASTDSAEFWQPMLLLLQPPPLTRLYPLSPQLRHLSLWMITPSPLPMYYQTVLTHNVT